MFLPFLPNFTDIYSKHNTKRVGSFSMNKKNDKGKDKYNDKYRLVPDDIVKNLVELLDEIQFEAAGNKDKDSMHKINFCSWAINELLESFDAYVKGNENKKSREDYVDETFMDWNLPDMTDKEYERLVDSFDNFLREWEKEYNKKNPKKKSIQKRPYRPHVEDVAEYMSLDEIKEYLLDDEELSNEERFDLYYSEYKREQRKKERRRLERGAKPLDEIMKELNIKPSNWKPKKK